VRDRAGIVAARVTATEAKLAIAEDIREMRL
jgi:hypothetical protein